MYEDMFASAKSGSNPRSKNFVQLSAQQQKDVLEFVEYLKSKFTQNSVNSYKSYIVKAMIKTSTKEELTNDEKSAVRKFEEFTKARKS